MEEPIKAIQTAPVQADSIQTAPVQADLIQTAPVQADLIQAAPVQDDSIQTMPVHIEQKQATVSQGDAEALAQQSMMAAEPEEAAESTYIGGHKR